MPENPQLSYVKEQIVREIGLYTERKKFNRKAAFGFTVIPATLAATATVSIGASEKLENSWLAIIAMIATGIASILGAWETLFANRKLWRVNNFALTSLYELQSDIAYREAAADCPISQDETDSYFDRLKEIRRDGEVGYNKAVSTD